jgi:hypothetical protein
MPATRAAKLDAFRKGRNADPPWRYRIAGCGHPIGETAFFTIS